MPPGGWGRRAAGKVDRKLEDDVLFKEIGGQLDASNFDYTQWQRTGRASGRGATRQPFPKREALAGQDRPFTVGSLSPSFQTGRHSATSSCLHNVRRGSIRHQMERQAEKRQVEALKVLQLRIRARRQTIEEYRRRQLELLTANMELRTQIEDEERVSHEEVKTLLRKYDKFRGGISTLNGKFDVELKVVKEELELTESELAIDLESTQTEVDELDKRLQAQLQELNILANYKDKEYPVKALRIADLQKEMEALRMNNDEEEDELERVVDTELDKMRKERQQLYMDIKEKATMEALSGLHPSLEDMALQNMVMEKELKFHLENHSELEAQIRALEAEVKKLLKDPKSNIRLQMFPEFFPPEQKCTPDMDVILNIPTQEWLPI